MAISFCTQKWKPAGSEGEGSMKLMLHFIKKHIGMFLIAVVFLTIETFADLLQPTFMSYIVDRGLRGRRWD